MGDSKLVHTNKFILLEFECRKYIIYHMAYEKLYYSIYKGFNFFAILFATFPVWSLINIEFVYNSLTLIGFIGTGYAFFNIIIQASKLSKEHENLRKLYYKALIKLYDYKNKSNNSDYLNEIETSILEIKIDSPPENPAFSAKCQNTIAHKMFKSLNQKNYLVKVPWYKAKTCFLISWHI